MRYILAVSSLVFISDQLLKFWVLKNLELYDSAYTLAPLFEITRAHNTGVAFSLFASQSETLKFLITVVVIFIAYFIVNNLPASLLLKTAYALLFGGALSNLVDRFMHGFVVDYINFLFIDFPVFNLADAMLNVAAAFLFISIFRGEKFAE